MKIGYINVEGPAVSQVWIRVGAEATVKYINSQLGGIAGRPIDLDVCKTLRTAETTTSCANKLIADHVSAVLIGTGGGFAGQIVDEIVAAGIPYVTTGANEQPELLSSKLRFVITGCVLRAAKDVPLPLVPGKFINCNGHRMAGYASVCSNTALLMQINGPTAFKLLKSIDTP